MELDCDNCSGAGFFGNGPTATFCLKCGGLGVLSEGSIYRFIRKDFGLAESADGKTDSQLRAGRKRA